MPRADRFGLPMSCLLIQGHPYFRTREGLSWNKLNKIFGGELKTIIHEINEAVAA